MAFCLQCFCFPKGAFFRKDITGIFMPFMLLQGEYGLNVYFLLNKKILHALMLYVLNAFANHKDDPVGLY